VVVDGLFLSSVPRSSLCSRRTQFFFWCPSYHIILSPRPPGFIKPVIFSPSFPNTPYFQTMSSRMHIVQLRHGPSPPIIGTQPTKISKECISRCSSKSHLSASRYPCNLECRNCCDISFLFSVPFLNSRLLRAKGALPSHPEFTMLRGKIIPCLNPPFACLEIFFSSLGVIFEPFLMLRLFARIRFLLALTTLFLTNMTHSRIATQSSFFSFSDFHFACCTSPKSSFLKMNSFFLRRSPFPSVVGFFPLSHRSVFPPPFSVLGKLFL